MPLFTVELNRVADSIGAGDLTVRLHTQAPTDAAPTRGRITGGGGVFVSGAPLPATAITDAASGDIQNTGIIDFGSAVGAVGTVGWWTAYRGSSPVAWGTLPSTTIANGDSFQINANSLRIMGSTT